MHATAELSLRRRFERLRAMKLNLDMTRGKPCQEQLDLSAPMLTSRRTSSTREGIDCRNYGYLEGLPEARKLFGEYVGMPPEQTFVLGNSSLAIMHDLVVQAMLRPLPGENYPWNDIKWMSEHGRPTMLCPVPGYDRHFSICERYGIRMVPVQMNENGPDMDVVAELVEDPFVVGMWCTPKYSNPSGITYSADVCRRLAWLRTASMSFRVFWDLAYNVHDLEEPGDELPDFFELCKEAGHQDRPFIIGSTSKVTFAGGGIGVFAASESNLAWFRESLFVQTIGGDKLNQLRHVEFLHSMDGVREHMRKHAAIIKPKFDVACETFEKELGGRGIASWQKPRGGYFIALKIKAGCAKKTVTLAGELGVKLTPAGSTHPYKTDPEDEWIRFAPTFPPLEEVRLGAEVLALCLRIAVET